MKKYLYLDLKEFAKKAIDKKERFEFFGYVIYVDEHDLICIDNLETNMTTTFFNYKAFEPDEIKFIKQRASTCFANIVIRSLKNGN